MTLNKMSTFVICPNPAMDIQAKISGFEPKQPTRMVSELYYPGGKGIHVAMALQEFNIPTILLGVWGKENGDQLKRMCKDFYPTLEIAGPYVDGWNRSCYSFVSDNEWTDTELLGAGPTVDENIYEAFIDEIKKSTETIASVAICGSWPKGAAPNSSKKIIDFCSKLDIPVFIDTTGLQLTNALKAKPHLVHLNRREVCEMFNNNFMKAMDDLGKQCDYAAVTDGKEGLYLLKNQSMIHANVQLKKDVISTIGSGDCLLAGLISAHYSGLSDVEVSRMGVAFGAANCIRKELGMLHKKEVEELYKQSYLEEV